MVSERVPWPPCDWCPASSIVCIWVAYGTGVFACPTHLAEGFDTAGHQIVRALDDLADLA